MATGRSDTVTNIATDKHLPYTDPHIHQHISNSRKDGQDLGMFLQQHEGDPAIKVLPFCSSMCSANIPFLFRIFIGNFTITCSHAYGGMSMMGMKGITLRPSTTLSG